MIFVPDDEIRLMPTKDLVAFYVSLCDAVHCTEPGQQGGIALDDLKRKALAELDVRRKPVVLGMAGEDLKPGYVKLGSDGKFYQAEPPKKKRGRPRKVPQ